MFTSTLLAAPRADANFQWAASGTALRPSVSMPTLLRCLTFAEFAWETTRPGEIKRKREKDFVQF